MAKTLGRTTGLLLMNLDSFLNGFNYPTALMCWMCAVGPAGRPCFWQGPAVVE
ncbi:hypothetical protein OO184_13160 [Photorhabdus sp. APURE]|uniref:hypothetical protein n=1 Tax=Photorhabdus aballayi TaxID=2991723 RepID=UPI00223D1044|nr:hypothetical protein [Photorhabdus aballayi]MCW7548856.1 hypothetical protein [Photorhabdus aballayi]